MDNLILKQYEEVVAQETKDNVIDLIDKKMSLIPFSPITKISEAGKCKGILVAHSHYASIKTKLNMRAFKAFRQPYKNEKLPAAPVNCTNDLLFEFFNEETEPFVNVVEESLYTKQCEQCGGQGEVKCPECHGNGIITCPRCGGSGEVTEHKSEKVQEPCYSCHGSGKILDGSGHFKQYCTTCNASGFINKTQYYEVKVRCPKCHGDRTVTCPTCNGSGKVVCPACEGSGEMLYGVQLLQENCQDFRILNLFPEEWKGQIPLLLAAPNNPDGSDASEVDLEKVLRSEEEKKADKEYKQIPQDVSILGNTEILADIDCVEQEDELVAYFDRCKNGNEMIFAEKFCNYYQSFVDPDELRIYSMNCQIHQKNYYAYAFSPDFIEGVENKEKDLRIYLSLQDNAVDAKEVLAALGAGDLKQAETLLSEGKIEQSLQTAMISYFKGGKDQTALAFIKEKIIGNTNILLPVYSVLGFGFATYIADAFQNPMLHVAGLILGAITALLFNQVLNFNLNWKLSNPQIDQKKRSFIFCALSALLGLGMLSLCSQIAFHFTASLLLLAPFRISYYHIVLLLPLIYLAVLPVFAPTAGSLLRTKLPELNAANGTGKIKKIEKRVLHFCERCKHSDLLLTVEIPIGIVVLITIFMVCGLI